MSGGGGGKLYALCTRSIKQKGDLYRRCEDIVERMGGVTPFWICHYHKILFLQAIGFGRDPLTSMIIVTEI